MIARLKAFANVLRESPHPVRLIWAQVLVKTGFSKYFTIPMNGYKLKFSRSALAVTLFSNRNERHEDEDFLKRILRPGDVYVDVGANIGTLVLSASSIVGNEGKILGIEAHPATFNNLRENISLNGFRNISVINAAVGNKKGNIFFSNMNSDDQNKVLDQGKNGIEVKMDTLDSMLEAVRSIDVLKIDVEGYEKFVLDGGVETLNKTRIVFFESWEKHFNGFGYGTGDILTILKKNGFEVYKPMDNDLVILSPSYKSINCENLIAVKDIRSFCSEYMYAVTPSNN